MRMNRSKGILLLISIFWMLFPDLFPAPKEFHAVAYAQFGGSAFETYSIQGTADPTVGPGVSAYINTLYLKTGPGVSVGIWRKNDNGLSTNWTQIAFYPGAFPIALANGDIFVGNASNLAAAVSMSGAATISNTGVVTLSATGVTPGVYSLATITVGADGRISLASSGASSIPLADGKIFVGNVSNVATPVFLSGGVSISDTGFATLGFPGASTLGGVESYTSPAHQWVTGISTAGVVSSSQPNYSDIAGSAPAPTGTANEIPFYNGAAAYTTESGSSPAVFSWDTVHHWLGIRTAPQSVLDVSTGTTSGSVGDTSVILGLPDATHNIGSFAVLEGLSNIASGAQAHAEGNTTTASGGDSHAEGQSSTASGSASHAEGTGTVASNLDAHAEGASTTAAAQESHAEGHSTSITSGATAAHAEGTSGSIGASATSAHVEGASTTALSPNAHAEGSLTTASGANSHAEGQSTNQGVTGLASNTNAHSEGKDTTASGLNSHAEGQATTANGTNGHAEGDLTTAGSSAHAEGLSTTASGTDSHAEGAGSTAAASASHAEGNNNNVIAGASFAHAEGSSNTVNASATSAHVEGSSNIISASAANAHAEGTSSTASGTASHAEGTSTASANTAHSEGNATIASNSSAHAEGDTTTASGTQSHAEGSGTTASGIHSHAGGFSSVADGLDSFAQGSKAQTGGFAGAAVWTDSQGFQTTADSADQFKQRYTNGTKLVQGGGADNVDGPNFSTTQGTVSTTNNTYTTIQTLSPATNTIMLVEARVAGRRTDVAGNSSTFIITARIKNLAGTVTVNDFLYLYSSFDDSNTDATFTVSGTNVLIQVRGNTAQTYTWDTTTFVQSK